jgi:lipopolysaccharide export system permease protein
MNTVSTYVFRQALGPLLAILGALAAIAILTQGLNQLDLIITNRRAGLAFAWVTILALPQLISLILPMAVFIAVAYALNRMQNDSEVAVLFGAGVSRRSIARPVVQLATLAALAHLAIGAIIQPAASEQRREILFSVRNDIASSLVQEGSFTFPADGLTLYASSRGAGGELRDLMVDDARPKLGVTYTARAGAIATIELCAPPAPADRLIACDQAANNGAGLERRRAPVIVMRDGQIHSMDEEGKIGLLDFDRYVLQLGDAFEEPELFFLKPSDRTLFDLFFPDRTAHFDQRNIGKFLAEAHARLAAPLLNIALALIAIVGMLGGQFSRGGYGRRIMYAAMIALVVRLVALAVPPSAEDAPELNLLQYALPLLVIVVCSAMLGGKRPRKRRVSVGPTVLAGA